MARICTLRILLEHTANTMPRQWDLGQKLHRPSYRTNTTRLALFDDKQAMSLESACKLAAKVLKQVMEEKINATNAQLCTITREHGFKIYTESELQSLLAA